jgi:2-aminoethylphosphonate-pyruvate transaminase
LQSNHSTSLSLDLLDQWNNFEKTGQFRFTPPTHTIVAFNKAITDYEKQGGLNARIEKYKKHYSVLYSGMIKMGFVPFLPVNMQGYFITSFLYPNENFDFTSFYNHLKDNGLVIYPGKTTNIPSFRIGNIGNLYLSDIEKLLVTIHEYMDKNYLKSLL